MNLMQYVSKRFRYFALLNLDHYHTLGVERSASKELIEVAYRSLLGELSAGSVLGRFGSTLLGQSEARLIRARDILLCDEERAAYDKHLDWMYTAFGNPLF